MDFAIELPVIRLSIRLLPVNSLSNDHKTENKYQYRNAQQLKDTHLRLLKMNEKITIPFKFKLSNEIFLLAFQ